MIPYGKQDIRQQDIDAVVDVLESDFLTQGPKVPAFEQSIKDYTGAQFAFAMNSATSALHVACMAMDLVPGDLLWTSPITFVASANCALYCGASIDFVDIDSETFNICPMALEKKLELAKSKGSLPKILVAVHLSGQSCDMKSLSRLSKIYGFRIIEDASHAVGASYLDGKVGNNAFCDVSIFSFHPVKIVTTAEGGVATTNDAALADRIELLRSHGVTRDEELMTHEPDGPWYYQQIVLGYNYRMTEMQAALGLSQMQRLDEFVEKRNEIANYYLNALSDLPLKLPKVSDQAHSSWHLFIVRLCLEDISLSHKDVFVRLREEGLGVNLHYIPVHLQPYYKNLGFEEGSFPEAEQYYKEAISLPLHPGLSNEQMQEVVCIVRKVILSD